MANSQASTELPIPRAIQIAFGTASVLGCILSLVALIITLRAKVGALGTVLLTVTCLICMCLAMWGGLGLLGLIWPRRLHQLVLSGIRSLAHRRKTSGGNRLHVIESVLDELSTLLPQAKCRTHQTRISQSFLGFKRFLRYNLDQAWLQPPMSDDIVQQNEHVDNFLKSELLEWTWCVVGNKAGIQGLIEDTRYLFITWDLRNLRDWRKPVVESLGELLTSLGIRTGKGDLLVHRVIVVRWNELLANADLQREFLDEIWAPYFEPYVGVGNECYKIKIIDFDSLTKLLANHQQQQDFLDVALFSFSLNIKKVASSRVLPSPDEANDSNEYAALQFSYRDHANARMINLFIVHGQSANRRGYEEGDFVIRQKREQCRRIMEQISSELRPIDGQVKNVLKIDYTTY